MPKRSLIAMMIAILTVVVGAVAVYAAIPDASGVIHACYSTQSIRGQHSVTLADGTCPTGTTLITWNQTGPPGPAGATGPAGPQGPQGATGAQGAQGIQGAPGVSHYEVIVQQFTLVPDQVATAFCPTGKRVLGGGVEVAADNNNNVGFDELSWNMPTTMEAAGWSATKPPVTVSLAS
jgi:hypothetical protein